MQLLVAEHMVEFFFFDMKNICCKNIILLCWKNSCGEIFGRTDIRKGGFAETNLTGVLYIIKEDIKWLNTCHGGQCPYKRTLTVSTVFTGELITS
jgi:hypothetical protein